MQHFITHAVEQYGYAAIFLLMLLESACVPIPSEVTMLFGGAFCTVQVGGPDHLSLVLVGLVGTLGNVVGSWIAYWVGWKGGRPLAERWGRFVFVRPHDLDRAEEWFARRGDPTVFFSRLLPVVRTFISLPAGIAEMPLGKFSLYTLLGCLPWTFALAGIGYALGTQWDSITKYFALATIVIAVIILAVLVWWFVVAGPRRRAADEQSPSSTESKPATGAQTPSPE
jgi:membrane protein DedA with SNARE-associated domain